MYYILSKEDFQIFSSFRGAKGAEDQKEAQGWQKTPHEN